MPLEFEIRFHDVECILEVRYPSKPTVDSYGRYEKAVKETIEGLPTGWRCLVDQSELMVMPPELPPRIAELNAWAKSHGMGRTARVVRESPTARLQVNRILKQSGAAAVASVANTRDEAWAVLLASSE